MCMGCVTRFDAAAIQAAGVAFSARAAFGALRARVAGTTELRRRESREQAEVFLRELGLDPDRVLGPVVPRAARARSRGRAEPKALPRRLPLPVPGAARGHA